MRIPVAFHVSHTFAYSGLSPLDLSMVVVPFLCISPLALIFMTIATTAHISAGPQARRLMEVPVPPFPRRAHDASGV